MAAVLAAALAAAAFEAGPAAAGGLPIYGGEIRLPREPGPVDLDPLRAETPLSRTLVHALFDTLFRVGPDGRAVPHLALRHEVSGDGLVWRIWIKPTATFHDGTVLTAREVKDSLERMLAPASGAWWLLAGVDGAAEFHKGAAAEARGIAVTGRYEIEIRLARPMPLLPLALSSPRSSIVRISTPGAGGGASGAEPGAAGAPAGVSLPVGTGPFRYARTEGDGIVVLEAFEESFAGGPYFDRVRFVPIQGSKEQGLALEIGGLDCALFEGGSGDEAKPGAPFLPIEGETIYVNVREKGPFAEASARAALNYAVDRGAIVEVLMRAQGETAEGILPPSLAPFSFVRRAFPYDLALARALKGGTERVRAKMVVPSGSPLAKGIAERVQVNLLDLGVEVTIEEADAREARRRFREGGADLALDRWTPELPDPVLSLAGIAAQWPGAAGGTDGFLPRILPLIEGAMSAATATQAVRSLFLAEREALVQVPWILLAHPRAGYLVSPAIGGLKCDFGGVLCLEDAWRSPVALRE